MSANAVSDRVSVLAAFDAYDSACEALAGLDFTAFTVAELLALQSRREHRARTTAGVDHRILAVLQTRVTPAEIGERTWTKVLMTRMRIGEAEAKRRVEFAEDLGPRYPTCGGTIEPALPATAAALAQGAISIDHVCAIRDGLRRAATVCDPAGCSALEATLATAARHVSPAEVSALADRAVYLMNQDGLEGPDPAAAKRGLTIGRQGPDGLSRVSGHVDAETAGYLRTLNNVLAARGVNNPDDPDSVNPLLPTQQPDASAGAATDTDTDTDTDTAQEPDSNAAGDAADDPGCTQPSPRARDRRTPPQRNHDALKAILRHALMSGRLGQHNGLPVTLLMSTTLSELAAKAGIAVTSVGTLVPMRDVIRLAGHAEHYLAVFDGHKSLPLYLGRARRTASVGQRLVMVARDRGCSRPGCTRPAMQCQGMHVDQDWIEGGPTDADNLGLGCDRDNQLAFDTGWSTEIGDDGRAHWKPPPLLDTGQDRINHHFHPEELLHPPDEDDRDDP
jgi:hypothetical protein